MKPTHTRYWVVLFALALAMIMYIQRVAISSTMGPGVKVDPSSVVTVGPMGS